MLHYVRGDGGMIVVPVEALKEWIAERVANAGWEGVSGNHWIDAKVLIAELEAMGK